MYLSGGFAITAGQWFGWPWVYGGIAALFVPMLVVVWTSPEPASAPEPPKSLRAAVVDPMIGIFKKSRAVEILLFIVLFKLGENLATALIRPFLISKGFTAADVGIAVTTISFFTTVGGTLVGGVLTDTIGMGRTLWLSGILQSLGCLGYALIDQLGGPASDSLVDGHRLLMYSVLGVEQIFQGMGAGAMGVLMLRLSSREFSATQFALLSSLAALGRVIVGPFAGVFAYSFGWTFFFFLTVPIALPGLFLLHKFVPFGSVDAALDGAEGKQGTIGEPITRGGLALQASVAFVVCLCAGVLWSGFLAGMADSRSAILKAASLSDVMPIVIVNVQRHIHDRLMPASAIDWADLGGPVVFAIVMAGATAALVATRRGIAKAKAEPLSVKQG
jgi:PAT family beta-lactamase induction signal transducer AmpG